jgi:hypothetical protein
MPEFPLSRRRRNAMYVCNVFLRSVLRLLITDNVPSSPILVTLMIGVRRFSETSVLSPAARRNIPEDGILHSHRRENLKFYTILQFLATQYSSSLQLPCLFLVSGLRYLVFRMQLLAVRILRTFVPNQNSTSLVHLHVGVLARNTCFYAWTLKLSTFHWESHVRLAVSESMERLVAAVFSCGPSCRPIGRRQVR